MNRDERLKAFAVKHGKTLVEPTAKRALKEELKGKQTLTPKDQTDLLIRISKDLGYL